MLYLQILAVTASTLIAIYLLGIFFIGSFNIKARAASAWSLFLGIPVLALAIWLPLTFGWIGV